MIFTSITGFLLLKNDAVEGYVIWEKKVGTYQIFRVYSVLILGTQMKIKDVEITGNKFLIYYLLIKQSQKL